MKLPAYQCHKKVVAAIIEDFSLNKSGTTTLILKNISEPYVVDSAFMEKHKPFIGGYLVIYEDGYQSFSPAHAFESGYNLIDESKDPYLWLTFGEALEALKKGKRIARIGWNDKNMFIYLKKGSFDGSILGFKAGEEVNPDHQSTMEGVKFGMFENGAEGTEIRMPNIQMRSASGCIVDGWLASQTDMLANDWMILKE